MSRRPNNLEDGPVFPEKIADIISKHFSAALDRHGINDMTYYTHSNSYPGVFAEVCAEVMKEMRIMKGDHEHFECYFEKLFHDFRQQYSGRLNATHVHNMRYGPNSKDVPAYNPKNMPLYEKSDESRATGYAGELGRNIQDLFHVGSSSGRH